MFRAPNDHYGGVGETGYDVRAPVLIEVGDHEGNGPGGGDNPGPPYTDQPERPRVPGQHVAAIAADGGRIRRVQTDRPRFSGGLSNRDRDGGVAQQEQRDKGKADGDRHDRQRPEPATASRRDQGGCVVDVDAGYDANAR
ncbi:hypothetical protein GCM10010160_54530 [Acrocarpospora corrugata]